MDTTPFPIVELCSQTDICPARGLYLQRQVVGERLSQVLATQASLELVSSAFSMLQTGLLAVSTLTRSLGLIFLSQ